MGENKRVLWLVLIMASASLTVAGVAITMLYRAAFEEERARLVETAQSQARLIEAVARFDAIYSQNYPGGSEDATLSQITDAHERYRGFGDTGEFTLARRVGDNIVFLLSHRHHDLENPEPIPFDSELAEPMRRALSGMQGTVIGLDYRGELVLAAHEPVGELNLGIVAKIDLAEVRSPFMRAGGIAVIIAMLVVLIGATLFLRITSPIMRRLKEHSQHLSRMVGELQESEEKLRQAHNELELRVEERTEELMQANDQLKLEISERTQAEERLRALWEIAGMVDSEYDYLCDHVLRGSLDMTQSRYAFYGFMSPDESVMSIHSWSEEAFEECQMRNKPIEFSIANAGLWATAIRERRTFIVNDYKADHPAKLGLPDGHVPLSRILVVPVFSHGKIVAVAAAANKPTDYTDEDARQLEAFASGVQVILDQRKIEKELRDSEGKYSTLVENSLTGIYINQDGEIAFANNRFAEIYGYTRDEVIGMKAWTLVHPEDKGLIDDMGERRLSGEEAPSRYEARGLKKEGETIWVARRNTLIEYKDKPAILGNIDDITQRKRMEEALLKSEKECRLLSRQVMAAEEKERKRYAREIHDGIGQSLAAIKFRSEGYLRMIKDETATSQQIESVIQMIQNTMDEVRRIQNDLRPAYLDELGIMASLSGFCRDFQATYSGIKVERQIEISEEDVPDFLKTPIYRIFQESMNNVAKHSNASQVCFLLRKADEKIELAVEDNGVGFETECMPPVGTEDRGLGFCNMKERAELSGASFEVNSHPGKGTIIRTIWSF
jgi:PAS domain S-box-containing protein